MTETKRGTVVFGKFTGKSNAKTYIQTSFGGGGGGPVDMTDTKIAAAEARTDTKFAEMRGDFADLRGSFSDMRGDFTTLRAEFATLRADLKGYATKSTVWQAAATIIAVVLAAIAFGGDRFDAGIGMADIHQAQMQRDAKQDEAVSQMDRKLDKLIEQTKRP